MYKFKLKPAANDQYRVQFLYNSEIMVWSENYKAKAGARNCIASIKENAVCSPIVDLTNGESDSGYRWEIVKATNGEFFTRFKASNGETMVRSETYPDKRNARNCAESVSKNAPDAVIIDETVSNVA